VSKDFQKYSERKEGNCFMSFLTPCRERKYLIWGGDGSHFHSIIRKKADIYVADIAEGALKSAEQNYGYKTILLQELGNLPFPENFFDIVFCSSVIEHVTVEKGQTKNYLDNRIFHEKAYNRQRDFAKEIQRIAERYFVQTPNKWFPIESHTWLPFFILLMPRSWQINLIAFMNQWWPKKTSPDWDLLNKQQMQHLFPDADIRLEKSLGFTKSIIAIKN
jgi:hypothetical protein